MIEATNNVIVGAGGLDFQLPANDTPIEETVDTIQELYRQGKFKRFGLSNFLPDDVRKIHAYAKSTGGVLPTTYQGHYNAFARTIEKDLFPLLRQLGIAFYAYSPLAGGFFAKDPEEVASKSGSGRFDLSTPSGQMYDVLYNKASTVEGLREWKKLAEKIGISSVALAYRWVVFHSHLDGGKGDAVIIGASRPAQLEQTLKVLEDGPLDEETVRRVEELWKLVEAEAPLDNYNDYVVNL
ncbi:putative NADP-dependent oxidoreductase domain-containing protein [Septoria linicola]|nr:putative NADP-dependent oxidoreductase domain-containing protein [Septoria linicola]